MSFTFKSLVLFIKICENLFNPFPRAKLEENCELRVTDNVQGQISVHIFAPNGDYCLYYPSTPFPNARSFENWGIFSDIPQF